VFDVATQLINFTIPKKLLTEVDGLAKRQLKSRSEILREAAWQLTKRAKEKERNFRVIQASAERINMTEGEAIKLVDGIRNGLQINK